MCYIELKNEKYETLEDLKANFDDMKKAFELPVLDLDTVVYAEIDK